MKWNTTSLACAAAAMMSVALSAQAPRPESSEQFITVTGCIQREADYRKATDAGKGGVAGTGVGVSNEFVLTNTSGAAAWAGSAFELTGPAEEQAGQHVGKRVEIAGKLKAGDTNAAGPTGGPTAGAPPQGVDVASKDLKLRELEVTSIKAATTGTCPG